MGMNEEAEQKEVRRGKEGERQVERHWAAGGWGTGGQASVGMASSILYLYNLPEQA